MKCDHSFMVVSGANNDARCLQHESAGQYGMAGNNVIPANELGGGNSQATSGPRDDTVGEFLARIHLPQLQSNFEAQMIETMEDLMPMGDAQLQRIGIMAAGHRNRIITERTRGEWKATSKK